MSSSSLRRGISSPGYPSHEHRDSVLHDLDLAFEVGDQGRGGRILDLRLLVDRFGRQTAVEAQLGLAHVLAPRLERAAHDGQFVVEGHQLEVGRGDLCHQRHAHRAPLLDRGEVFGASLAFRPAEVPPEVELPAHGGLHADLGVVREALVVIVVRLAFGICRPRHDGQAPGLVDAVELAHALDVCCRGEHLLVAVQRAADQVAERRVAVEAPPRHVGNGRRVGLPFGDRLREVQLGRLAVAHGRTGCQEQGRGGRAEKDRQAFHCFLNFDLRR